MKGVDSMKIVFTREEYTVYIDLLASKLYEMATLARNIQLLAVRFTDVSLILKKV